MAATMLLLLSSLASLVAASPTSKYVDPNKQWTFTEIPPTHSLTWYPCRNNYTCAMLDVPLDYTNRKLGRSYVPLIRYAATTKPYKGMLLANPGGPGGSGVDFIPQLVAGGAVDIIGSNYDLVSWDPRGIGQSIPAANCTIPADLQGRSLNKLSGPYLLPNYYEQAYNSSVEIGIACQNSIGGETQAGPHVTTATVVRDLITILDAYARSDAGESFGEDAKLLNYWGFSYGTFVGQTFASMFPKRLGRVILDGNVNPYDWVQGTGRNFATDTDEVFSTFFVYCNAAGPVLCPFATGTTAHDIYLRFESLVNKLDPAHAFTQGWDNATAIEVLLAGVKNNFFSFSYEPISGFPLVGQGLVLVEAIIGNVTFEAIANLEALLGIPFVAPFDPSQLWIRTVLCTDTGGIAYGKTLDQLYDRLPALTNETWLAGESTFAQLITCAGYPITSKYRYAGPFTGKTNNPILFVENTLDTVTPHQNGVNATARFTGSQLLTIEGIGHTSLAPQNKCSYAKINTFLQTGTLPGTNNYCPLEAGPWNITLPGPLSGFSDKRDLKAIWPSVRG